MNPDFDKLRGIFLAAVELSAPAERQAYLVQACAGDENLRRHVDILFKAHTAGEGPLDHDVRGNPTTHYRAAPETTDTVIGPYKLLQPIGEGGMGTVWLAEQTQPVKRRVALKVVKAGMDSQAVLARFEAERQALALMDHPNIAKVLDAGTTGEPGMSIPGTGRPYFVMELVKGVPITKFCDERQLTPRHRLELFVPVCQAIQHAHQKGIIHRDIKPSNVLVALYDDKPVPKVIDFGVAKAMGQQLTEQSQHTGFGQVVGTLEYMSPEQASSNQLDVDTRSDIYSLGVLLYELLAGSPPFSSKELKKAGVLEMLRVIREQEPSKPSTKLSTAEGLPSIAAQRGTEPKKLTKLVRGELDWIVMRALEKDRNHRYETANSFAVDVQRYLSDEPVQACPPSAGYRLRKFVRRHKRTVLAAGLVLIALLAGVIGTTWGLILAQQARKGEEKQRLAAEANAERAQQGFAKAKEAVETYLSKVTEDPDLRYKHDLSGLRKKLLDAAVPYYEWFTKQQPGEPALEAERGRAYWRLAFVRREMGEREAALKDYERTLPIFEKLAADFPAVASYRGYLAVSHLSVGVLLGDLGQMQAAERALRRAVDLDEQLVAENPNVPNYREDLANGHNHLGILLNAANRKPEAERAYRRAVDLQERLAVDSPAVHEYRRNLAMSHNNLGNLLNAVGRRQEAAVAHQRAIELQEKLVAELPSVPGFRHELAGSYNNRAILLQTIGELPGAAEAYKQARKHYEKLAAEFPSIPEYRRNLAGCYSNYGVLLNNHGQAEASLAWFDKAIVLLEPLVEKEPRLVVERTLLFSAYWGRAFSLAKLMRDSEALKDWDRALALNAVPAREFSLRANRAISLAGAGHHAQAADEANALATHKDVTGEALVNLAAVFAMAADKVKKDAPLYEQYASRAVALLRQALDRGFKDIARLMNDRDLDLLRERADFKKLLADLEAKKEPASKKQMSEKH